MIKLLGKLMDNRIIKGMNITERVVSINEENTQPKKKKIKK